jgi:hypothetical protein
MSPKVKVYPPGSPADVFGKAPKQAPAIPVTTKRGKGFLSRCMEIIIQDARDKLYAERARKRREYEDFIEMYGPKRPGNGVT